MSQHHKITIKLKRAYEEAAEDDGTRVLVDRIWPRGLSKERAHIDLWLKDIAPSNELRKWFAHDPSRFSEFRQRYHQELTTSSRQEALHKLREMARQQKITLIFSAHDTEHNNAVVLQDLLNE
ncbi:MAG TPA: DUF488 domain-containing protein [Ktedonobacteraceae bacterium]|jgi:uncharacterized protein YeaO (DUF488 family)